MLISALSVLAAALLVLVNAFSMVVGALLVLATALLVLVSAFSMVCLFVCLFFC